MIARFTHNFLNVLNPYYINYDIYTSTLSFEVVIVFYVGAITLTGILFYYLQNQPMTIEEAEEEVRLMCPEQLWQNIEDILYLYITNVGVTMPLDHTWYELAAQLHGESRDFLFLLSILTDIVDHGLKSDSAIRALSIIHKWEFPSSSLGS